MVSQAIEKALPRATHGDPSRPLELAGFRIPCYVLQNGTRLFTQAGLAKALGMAGKRGGRIQRFLNGNRVRSLVKPQLQGWTNSPIEFLTPQNSRAVGYDHMILADLCDLILEAEEQGLLLARQAPLAKTAKALLRAFARVGLTALVDEVTGYQVDRPADALQEMFRKLLRDAAAPHQKRFPDAYFTEICRLRNYPYEGRHKNPPRALAKITLDVVYSRILPPEVLEELKQRDPVEESGNRREKLHQWLTSEVGLRALSRHLDFVVVFLMMSGTWNEFERKLNAAFPKPDNEGGRRLFEVYAVN